ncbi:MAG: NAD(+)/NADH kinase [Acidimicrobiales bacterium]
MACIVLLIHHTRSEAVAEARNLGSWLVSEGHTVLLPAEDAAIAGLETFGADEQVIAGSADLAVSLGGDGSMLRAVTMVADGGVPVLGINFGQLGYLTQVDPVGCRNAVGRWLTGDFIIEERMRVSVVGPDGTAHCALNEIVCEKTEAGHTVRIAVQFDGEAFHTYETDGLIVATPTGSTAYSLSARGPIVDPTHRALVFTPVAPHTLFDRSLVLAPGTRVQMTIEDRPAALSVDGQFGGRIEPGQSIECRAADEPARLVSFGDRNFHRVIKSKFDLSER